MALFSEGGGTFPDVLIVVCLLTCSLIAFTVNPVVFIYNCRQLKSVPQFLFRLLATVDFITCLVIPITVSMNVLKRHECKTVGNTTVCPQPPYLEEHGNVTITEKVLGTITWTLLITPPIITALLTTSRYLQIRYPLRPIQLRYIVVFLFLYLVYVVVCLSCLFFQPNTRYYSRIQSVWNIFPGLDLLGTVLAFTGPCIVCQVLSVFFSILTIWELFKSIRDPTAVQLRKHGWKCSLKILITNFGSILFMTFYLAMIMIASTPVKERSKTDCILYLMYSVAVPVFLSVFNPVVFVIFTTKTFKVAWEKFTQRQTLPSRAQTIDFLNSQPKHQTAKETLREKLGEIPKVYQIGETSTVCQVKRISEQELQNMVYSNFHTIRKETENAVERVQSPVVFDLSEGADRQRRVTRFRSMEQSDALISPVSCGDDNNSVFSRSASVNVARRDNKSARGIRSRTESEGVVDTKSFPNVAAVKKTVSAIDVVAENETESKCENVAISNTEIKSKTVATDETEIKSGTVAINETECKSEITTISETKFISESVAVEEIVLETEIVSDIGENIESGDITESAKDKEAEVIAEIIVPTVQVTERPLEIAKPEDILSNSDNMCVGDSDSNNESESEWEMENGAECSGLRRKQNNTNDKPLNATSTYGFNREEKND